MSKVTLVQVDDYRYGLYFDGKCISNAAYDDADSLLHVLCDHLGLRYESIFAETEEELDTYLPDRYRYVGWLPYETGY